MCMIHRRKIVRYRDTRSISRTCFNLGEGDAIRFDKVCRQIQPDSAAERAGRDRVSLESIRSSLWPSDPRGIKSSNVTLGYIDMPNTPSAIFQREHFLPRVGVSKRRAAFVSRRIKDALRPARTVFVTIVTFRRSCRSRGARVRSRISRSKTRLRGGWQTYKMQ